MSYILQVLIRLSKQHPLRTWFSCIDTLPVLFGFVKWETTNSCFGEFFDLVFCISRTISMSKHKSLLYLFLKF